MSAGVNRHARFVQQVNERLGLQWDARFACRRHLCVIITQRSTTNNNIPGVTTSLHTQAGKPHPGQLFVTGQKRIIRKRIMYNYLQWCKTSPSWEVYVICEGRTGISAVCERTSLKWSVRHKLKNRWTRGCSRWQNKKLQSRQFPTFPSALKHCGQVSRRFEERSQTSHH